MPRPFNKKRIRNNAEYTCFKPAWVPRHKLKKIEITAEEFEAYRLTNYDLLSNIEWAKKMETSSSTFNRLVKSANNKIADWLVNWKWIRIFRTDEDDNCD